MKHKVFISYSDADRSLAGKIYAALECHGVRCWMSGRDLPFEADFQAGTTEAIEAAQLVLLVFSSSANLSRKVIKELSLRDTKPLIVVRVEDVLPAGEFQRLVPSIEFHDLFEDFDARLELFCRHVRAVLQTDRVAKPVVPGAPPGNTVRRKVPMPVWAALALVVLAVGGFRAWRAFGPGVHFWVPDTAESAPAKAAPLAESPPATADVSAPVAPAEPAETAAAVTAPPVLSVNPGVPKRVEPRKPRVQPRRPEPKRNEDLAVADARPVEPTARHAAASKPSFNCKYARTRAEHMICSDPDLAAADVELDRAYRAARQASPDKELLNKLQTEWRRSVRDTCPDADCILNAYEQRIDELY